MNSSFGPLLAICLSTLFLKVHSEEESIFQSSFRKFHSEPLIFTARSAADVETLWIEQKLDNFDDTNNRTWKMRYMANGEFFQEGAPVFIVVGGEWCIDPNHILAGHVFDMAKEHNGYLFYTEHRFYGESRPTSDLSIENLQFLHVKQALVDLAHFIRTMKATMPGMANSKFILRGCSYAATMVTWFKKLYPDLVVGAWATSGPFLAKVDFVEYKEVAGQSYRKVGGDSCYNRIKNGFHELESMFENNRSSEVLKRLNVCNNFNETNDLDVWTLFEDISTKFVGVAQNENVEVLQEVCNTIMKENDDLDGIFAYIRPLHGLEDRKCTDMSYESKIKKWSNLQNFTNSARQWIYQSCNEYGWFLTSNSRSQPFGTKYPLNHYLTICYDLYGEKFTKEFIHKQVKETNNFFGGLEPNVENVYFTYGGLDPWHALGILEGNQTTVIPMYTHCKDLESISDSDTPEMRASKERIAELVRDWVK